MNRLSTLLVKQCSVKYSLLYVYVQSAYVVGVANDSQVAYNRGYDNIISVKVSEYKGGETWEIKST